MKYKRCFEIKQSVARAIKFSLTQKKKDGLGVPLGLLSPVSSSRVEYQCFNRSYFLKIIDV